MLARMILCSSFRRYARPAVICVALILLASCAERADPQRERSVEDLYNDAMNQIDIGGYEDAAKLFDEVERQHPYSLWATKAQLMGAYSQYEKNKYDDALALLDRFIQLHPGNRDAPYAYYLKGLCYYEQIVDVGRDQRITERALAALQEVVDRFPTSKYARDARMKVDLTRDHLAGKEMAIGRYYQNRGQFLAALKRFKVVTAQFQTTTHAPEALHRQVEIYVALGMIDDAKKTAAVLGYNFPGSDWYKDTYDLLTKGRSASLPPPDSSKKGKDKSSGWFSWLW